MPVLPTSRYAALPTWTVDGRLSLGQRLLVPDDQAPTVEHRLEFGETLDLLATKYYGRADLWWRIADADPRRFPMDFRVGEVVLVPLGPSVTRRPEREG